MLPRQFSRRHSFDEMEIVDPARATAIYEVNNPNSFDFYVAPAAAENDFSIPPPMDDFDNFDFFDGFEFDDDDDDNNTATNKRSNSPEYFADLSVATQEQEEAKLLLGVYNQEERAKLLEAYREKRKRRVYGKVRYVLRQKVSENRPRVKGRFVTSTPVKTEPPPPPSEDERPRKRPSVISVFKNWTLSSTRLPAASPQSSTTSSSCGSTPPAPPSKRSSLPPISIPFSLHTSNNTTSPRAAAGGELWSERLMELRNKKRNNSTTAASTESHKAKREVPFVTAPKPPA